MKALYIRWNANPLLRNFLVAIVVGLVVFVAIPAVVYDSVCKAKQPITWRVESYDYLGQGKYENKQLYGLIARGQKADHDGERKDIDKSEKRSLSDWICEETKITDLLLVCLTYSLVVVGYFAMRAVDETTKRTERAYLLIGGLFGVPKPDIDQRKLKHRPSATMFDGPWRMTLYNFGKTPGYCRLIEYGFCPASKFPPNRKVSELVKDPEFSSYLQESFRIQNVFPTAIDEPYQLRHATIERDKYIDYVMFGVIWYKDIFGASRYSAFSYLLTKDSSDGIGTSLSDDHGEGEPPVQFEI
jgi:hypothetical protein